MLELGNKFFAAPRTIKVFYVLVICWIHWNPSYLTLFFATEFLSWIPSSSRYMNFGVGLIAVNVWSWTSVDRLACKLRQANRADAFMIVLQVYKEGVLSLPSFNPLSAATLHFRSPRHISLLALYCLFGVLIKCFLILALLNARFNMQVPWMSLFFKFILQRHQQIDSTHWSKGFYFDERRIKYVRTPWNPL